MSEKKKKLKRHQYNVKKHIWIIMYNAMLIYSQWLQE